MSLSYMTAATIWVYLYLILRNIIFESQEKVSKTSVYTRPRCPLTFSFMGTRANLRTNLTLPGTIEFLPKIFAADNMCLSLLVFSNYVSHVAQSEPAKPAWKQNLTRNSHSRSFKVMHFGITERLTTDYVSLCNNAGRRFSLLTVCAYLPMCLDGQTDWQPDRIANTGLCIASYADAL